MPVVVPPPFTPRHTASLAKTRHTAQGPLSVQPHIHEINRRAITGAARSLLLRPCTCGAVHRLAQGGHRVARRQCSQQTHRSLNVGKTLDLSLSSPLHHLLLTATITPYTPDVKQAFSLKMSGILPRPFKPLLTFGAYSCTLQIVSSNF